MSILPPMQTASIGVNKRTSTGRVLRNPPFFFMQKNFCRKKGQGISAEYVILIVLVSISIAVMTTYVRRTLQARYRDGNRMVYMKASAALGNAVQPEYEPYYVNTATDVDAMTADEQKVAAGGAVDKTNISERSMNTVSEQKPF